MNSFGARFGALVKHRRGIEGLTQQALAVKAFGKEGNKARISELENGRVPNPHQSNIDALTVALNLCDADIAACHKPRVPNLPEGFIEKIGISQELVDALSWGLGFANPRVSLNEYQDFLTEKAKEVGELQARIGALGKANERIANLLAAAQVKIEQGGFGDADEILRVAEEVQQAEHTVKHVRKQAEIRAARGSAALLRGDADTAYTHFRAAAEFFNPFDPLEGGKHRRDYYNRLFNYGLRFGGSGFVRATGLARRNLEIYTKAQHPVEWATTQAELGLTLQKQGSRTYGQAGAKLLTEAGIALRAALQVLTENAHPMEWASTQNRLGVALWALGNRTENSAGATLLAQSVEAYRAALRTCNESAHPVTWASTQNNLGISLWAQGMRAENAAGIPLLAEAAGAHRLALRVFTLNERPVDWARTHNNLGLALLEQGKRTKGSAGAALLVEAVENFRDALQVFTEDHHPVFFAVTQSNLGIALTEQGDRAEGSASVNLLAAAVIAFRAALRLQTEDAHPVEWAETNENIGNAQEAMAEKEPQRALEHLAVALDCFNAALRVFDPKHMSYRHGLCSEARQRVMAKLRALESG